MARSSSAFAAGAAHLVLSVCVWTVVNKAVPYAYMDEPFHVNQTQLFCGGNYSHWDDKITTLPGLYVLSHGVSAFTQVVAPSPCSVELLRLNNVVLGVLLFAVTVAVLRQLHPSASGRSLALHALSLSTLPLLFFFQFLFYTDVGSLFFTLLFYLCYLKKQGVAAFLGGSMAVLFRQTNIMWVVYFALANTVDEAEAAKDRREDGSSKWYEKGIVGEVYAFFAYVWKARYSLLLRLLPPSLLAAGFVIFVKWNGGIVVGDRSNHQPVFHLAQVAYFCLFSAALLSPLLLCRIRSAMSSFAQRPAGWIVLGAILVAFFALAVQYFTIEHPFLLSDNRHYTFYLWKRFLSKKVVLSPVYAAAAVALLLVSDNKSVLWRIGFFLTTSATLVPTPLLEPRYFLPPFAVLFLHLSPSRSLSSFFVISMYAIINVACIYMFVARPFTWVDGSEARFLF
mmetsp:Transcript_13350/g.35044  ORF Transcript_13350/g.35044 Transcript_13350/m.35044 type:complete len:452 (-) Transcript_13350:284-1639(-)